MMFPRRACSAHALSCFTAPATAALAVLFTLSLSQAAWAQTPDHFTCYRAKRTAGTGMFEPVPGVGLVDAFRSSTVEVKRSKLLCAPTNKNNEDPGAQTHPDHLDDHMIKPTAKFNPVANQRIVDQFNPTVGLRVDVKKPVGLQVPAAKSLSGSPTAPTSPAVDHFTCYRVRVTTGTPKFVSVPGVTIQDQFGTRTVEVKKPSRLCAPTNKNGEDPGADTHVDSLMCYKIKQTSLPAFSTITPIFINDQFGPQTLDAKKPSELCVPALRNPAAAATPTFTPAPTQTPTPVPTQTPGANCGNAIVDPGEQCDGLAGSCPGSAPCTALCTCGCDLPNPAPATLSLLTKPGVDLDTGWTGQSHDLPGVDFASTAAVRLNGCDLNPASSTCGNCTLDGPIAFPGASKNCRCFNLGNRDSSSLTTCDPEMPSTCTVSGESCQCFYGSPLPLTAGSVSVCVTNRAIADITGTANIADIGPHAGEGTANIRLESAVHIGPTTGQPCPICVGDTTPRDGVKDGTCQGPASGAGGPKEGQACDVAGNNSIFGAMSFDCPPASAANVGNLTIQLNTTTGTSTLGSTGVKCTNSAFQAVDCICNTCATQAAEACNSDADCPNGALCGGLRCIGGTNSGGACPALGSSSACPNGGSCGRRGQATKPNDCDDATCSPDASNPDTPDDGVCEVGPVDSHCSVSLYKGCTADQDCNAPNCTDCNPSSGQTCVQNQRNCFLDPIVRTGMPGTQMSVLAATFCIPPTNTSPAVNSASGLPGPGGLLQPTLTFRGSADCGNGVIDSGEDCDPPTNGPCAGQCLPNCQCPMCQDGMVNQLSEECDGTDDSNCPGQCQANCTCQASVCGDNTIQFGEECDGTATGGDCPPSACQGNCTCGPYCGDSIVNGSEECDGGGAGGQCPSSACQGDCTCGDYCGDGIINGSPVEACDGAATGSCAGSCASDCTCAPFCGNNIREAGETCDGTDSPACTGQCGTGTPPVPCSCPSIGTLSFVVQNGADLDTGWTGESHDFGVQKGSTIAGVIGACDGMGDVECTFFGNVGSACSADGSISCLASTDCPVGQSCIIQAYGPPLPLSSGGVPVCVVNRFVDDVTGTYNLQTGVSEIVVHLNSLVHVTADTNQPCPVCSCANADKNCEGGTNDGGACTSGNNSACPGGGRCQCNIGDTGTCSDNPLTNCTVDGVGPLGSTSQDCPPNPAGNVSGNGLDIQFNPATTGTTSRPTNQTCDGAGFTSQMCWCDGQSQPNACENGCDGGSNDGLACASDANCPGAPAGACKPLCRSIAGETRPNQGVQATGEAECAVGPTDGNCSAAPQVSCTSDLECTGIGPCLFSKRRCFLDPIVRVGTPSTTSNRFGAHFCIPSSGSPAVDQVAGLPGPGGINFPNDVNVAYCGDGVKNLSEQCDGSDAANCPGVCEADCTCPAPVCGNGAKEIGEQCDPGGTPTPPPDDDACPGLCTPTCTCPGPPVCGDGVVTAPEQCDPGGPGGVPPASDTACAGLCKPVGDPLQCTCTTPVCGNGIIEGSEFCEVPAINCGALQVCNVAASCSACIP